MHPKPAHDRGTTRSAEPVSIAAQRQRRAQPKTTSRPTSRHLTIAEVCADLGISRSTFYDWRAKRKAPPCIKLPNGDLRIRRTDYERWLSSLAEEAA